MLWAEIQCTRRWYLPEDFDPTDVNPGRMMASHAVGVELTQAVAAAVNELDSHRYFLTPSRIQVRYELLGFTLNVEKDLVILVHPGLDDPNAPWDVQRSRLVHIHNAIYSRIMALLATMDPAIRPSFMLEILARSGSGSETSATGQPIRPFGGVDVDFLEQVFADTVL